MITNICFSPRTKGWPIEKKYLTPVTANETNRCSFAIKWEGTACFSHAFSSFLNIMYPSKCEINSHLCVCRHYKCIAIKIKWCKTVIYCPCWLKSLIACRTLTFPGWFQTMLFVLFRLFYEQSLNLSCGPWRTKKKSSGRIRISTEMRQSKATQDASVRRQMGKVHNVKKIK